MINLNKIKGCMREYGDTQETLANDLNISKYTLINYLLGKTDIPAKYIPIIAKRYNKDISYFFNI